MHILTKVPKRFGGVGIFFYLCPGQKCIPAPYSGCIGQHKRLDSRRIWLPNHSQTFPSDASVSEKHLSLQRIFLIFHKNEKTPPPRHYGNLTCPCHRSTDHLQDPAIRVAGQPVHARPLQGQGQQCHRHHQQLSRRVDKLGAQLHARHRSGHRSRTLDPEARHQSPAPLHLFAHHRQRPLQHEPGGERTRHRTRFDLSHRRLLGWRVDARRVLFHPACLGPAESRSVPQVAPRQGQCQQPHHPGHRYRWRLALFDRPHHVDTRRLGSLSGDRRQGMARPHLPRHHGNHRG